MGYWFYQKNFRAPKRTLISSIFGESDAVLTEGTMARSSTTHGGISEFITYFTLIVSVLFPIFDVLIWVESSYHYYRILFIKIERKI